MTDKEKLEKLKKLADAMYYAAQYLTTDASRLHKATDKYHKFIIQEWCNEEPVSDNLNTAAKVYSDNITDKVGYKLQLRRAVVYGAQWQKEQMLKKAVDATARPDDNELWCDISQTNLQDGQEIEVIIIKED